MLPAAFRKAVTESSGNKGLILIAKHDKWPCLTGFGLSRRDTFPAQIDREEEMAARNGLPFDRDLRFFQLYDCAEVAFDGSGRFIIPAHLRSLVGISDAIYFQGSGPFITLWSPEVLAAQDGPQWASAQANCTSLIAEAGKTRK
ncbi:division/cell wall cluster transcriptional repressor MraZ [Novosphingobium sp. FSY-8]|uniref:Division/cell wall cluster transcriptional repressor MraZ n=1 Tax=Novosphingobium ovatum TaxID=1908523 RepID=A0ABW9XE76_9SPHN|nr:division/cell wall cluster transcriptional repressor MraZ [Novosphingobium ovatum]